MLCFIYLLLIPIPKLNHVLLNCYYYDLFKIIEWRINFAYINNGYYKNVCTLINTYKFTIHHHNRIRYNIN